MRISVLMCVWNHLALSEAALRYLSRVRDVLDGEVEIGAIVVGSQGEESKRIAISNGFDYLPAQNKPVGRKFNMGLKALEMKRPDAVLVLGGDNFANPALFRLWAKSLEEGADYVGFLDATILNLREMRLIRWHGYPMGRRFGEVMGSGRCFSRKLLEEVDWTLWNGTLDQNLDWSTTVKLNGLGYKFPASFRQDHDGIAHLGVKTADAITAFKKYVRNRAVFRDIGAKEGIEAMFGLDLFADLSVLSVR